MTRLTKALAAECQLIRAAATMPGTGSAVYRAVLPMNRCMAIGAGHVQGRGAGDERC
jgi:hypothetical protein